MITKEELKLRFNYDENTGIFTYKKKTAQCVKIGSKSGSTDKSGYVRIYINYKYYSAHRLAWLFSYGNWPSKNIDHINGNKSDNRISNLRQVSQLENSHNRKPHKANKSGFAGVHYKVKNKKWVASIGVNWKRIHIGLFDTAELASAAYQEAKIKYHPSSPKNIHNVDSHDKTNSK